MAMKFDIKQLLLDKGERIGVGIAGGVALLMVIALFYTAFTGKSAASNKKELDDKRASVEESMKAREGKPVTRAFRICVTQEDLDRNGMIQPKDDDGRCKRNVLSRSATKLVIEQTCPAPHASTGKTTMRAKTPQSIVAVIDTVQGNASGKVHVDLKGRWIGASCEGIEE